MKKITLQVNGREMTFSEEELASILEKHFGKEVQPKSMQATDANRQVKIESAHKPTEGEWFAVDPMAIDQSLFFRERDDKEQEWTRKVILEAFAEMKNNSVYAKKFKTMMPEKTWILKPVEEMKKLAEDIGDHMGNWVEQALEWAQRIANGETWADISNYPDEAKWYRLVMWKNNDIRIVGGSRGYGDWRPAAHVNCGYISIYSCYVVPLVVRY